MEKTYQPQQIEQKWAEFWQSAKLGQPSGDGPVFSMMLPPPNVTGTLHMGHGFQQTLMDALTRYHKMRGFNTLWQMGTDHAGIATQMVVERQLSLAGKTRHDLGREAFLDKVWEWKEYSGNTITSQIKRLGALGDWDSSRFTMDEQMTKATTAEFVKLYQQGLIYRGQRLVNWDPVLNTAISNLEVVNEEEKGHLWHIKYPIEGSSEYITVATTRPETLFGDSAVAVHPDDERYQHLIGEEVRLPISNRLIPIIADDYVEKDFGSGAVKITPAHDFNDYEVGQRHNLPLVNIFTRDAKLNELAPKDYQGLDRFKARHKVVKALDDLDLLAGEEPHTLKVPRNERGNAVIEPYLTDQWFIKMDTLASKALAVVKEGRLKFIPENWTKTYEQWLDNIEDWCISRQLWWGHRIPAWYDDAGHIYVAETEQAAREQHQLSDDVVLKQDNDVLDTWFTSALWPFATLGWPDNTERLKTFYPTSVLITGFDIIFFWVARMVMMGLHFVDDVPFKAVYVTGLIRDSHGQKMSKSKGNVLDPLDLINGISLEDLLAKRTANLMQGSKKDSIAKATKKEFPEGIAAYGTDALRFTFCALATHGRDINFDMGRIEGYRNFCNKLWNATRFALMNIDANHNAAIDFAALNDVDAWIITQLQQTIQQATDHFSQYRFDLLATTLYEFVWNQFCDWYLELIKGAISAATQQVLLVVLETILRLLHPIMPFITEEIWQSIAPKLGLTGDSILSRPFPTVNEFTANDHASQQIELLKAVVSQIRTIRSEMNVSPAKVIQELFVKGDAAMVNQALALQDFIKKLAKVESIAAASDTLPASATAVVQQLELSIPLAGLIDIADEKARLDKEIAKLQAEITKLTQKLNNGHFVNKAPKEVVAKNHDKLADLNNKLKTLSAQLQQLDAI